MRTLLLILLPIIGVAQPSIYADGGQFISFQGEGHYIGWASHLGIKYEFDGARDGTSFAFAGRMGYMSTFDPSPTAGLAAYLGDEEFYYFGPFADYMFETNEIFAGLELHAHLFDITPDLEFHIGGAAGAVSRGFTAFFLKAGLKYNL